MQEVQFLVSLVWVVMYLSQLCASMDLSWSLMNVVDELAQTCRVLPVIVFGVDATV